MVDVEWGTLSSSQRGAWDCTFDSTTWQLLYTCLQYQPPLFGLLMKRLVHAVPTCKDERKGFKRRFFHLHVPKKRGGTAPNKHKSVGRIAISREEPGSRDR